MFCITLVCSSTIRACDACGCSANSFGIGLMTDYRMNQIRLGYFDTRFSSAAGHGHHSTSDVFTRMNLSFRYAFKAIPKLRFMGDISYGHNYRKEHGDENSIKGLSDTRLVVNYTILNNLAQNMKTAFYLEAGGGLSLPTGQYNAYITADDNLPENFNIGKGALAYIFQMNAVVSHDNYGLLFNQNYQLNSISKEGYHYGNQYSSQLTAFYEYSIGNFAIIPNAGCLFEYVASDKYSTGNRVPETGGRGLYFISAINFKTDKWLAGLSYSIPVDQHYSNGAVEAGGKSAVYFSFLF